MKHDDRSNNSNFSFGRLSQQSSQQSLQQSLQPQQHPVIICLTGFSSEEKDKYRVWIEELGGIYTRSLDVRRNTHLIAKEAQGDKYEAAKAAAAAGMAAIEIVRPLWLEECVQNKCWIPVRSRYHDFVVTTTLEKQKDHPTKEESIAVDYSKESQEMMVTLETIISSNDPKDDDNDEARFCLFSPCRFYLVGFEPDSKDFLLLCQLIRRGMGRISWTLDENVTHVVIASDSCDESVRDAAKLLQSEHPNTPDVVSPQWILACWKEKQLVLVELKWAPRYKINENEKALKKPLLSKKSLKTTNSTLFRNCLFTLLRVAPPSWAVDYPTESMEEIIQSLGGQLLTARVVDAILSEQSKKLPSKHKCFVVCWGGGDLESNLAMHATLGRVKHLVQVITVTPIWLETCRSENKLVSLSHDSTLLLFFRPTPWPLRRLPSFNHDDEIHIAVSGFSGSVRSALIHWITAMGGIYNDSLRTRTTHLVCAVAAGPKYERALKRNLFIVSLKWIFHVAQHGYSGKNGNKGGCECLFHPDKVVDTAES